MSNKSVNAAEKPSEQSVVHTPGPWEAIRCEHGWHVQPVNGPQSRGVCSIHDNTDGSRRDVQASDARLIAAAPDLLFACRLLMGHISEGLVSVYEEKADNGQPGISACELIEAAIKRAGQVV